MGAGVTLTVEQLSSRGKILRGIWKDVGKDEWAPWKQSTEAARGGAGEEGALRRQERWCRVSTVRESCAQVGGGRALPRALGGRIPGPLWASLPWILAPGLN